MLITVELAINTRKREGERGEERALGQDLSTE
jgi:hypothetical protein